MNAGYLSYVLLIVTIILLSFGWKENLVGSLSRNRIAVFFVCWISGWFYTIPVGADILIQGVYLGVVAVLIYTFRRVTFVHGVYLFTAGALGGVISYCLHVLYRIDPVMIVHDPALDIALVIGVIASLASRSVWQQAMVWSLACVASEVISVMAGEINHLGSGFFQDDWWVAGLTARLLTMIFDLVGKLYGQASRVFTLWVRALRK